MGRRMRRRRDCTADGSFMLEVLQTEACEIRVKTSGKVGPHIEVRPSPGNTIDVKLSSN